MNDKTVLNQKRISELESICDELNEIGKFSLVMDDKWNDEVSVEFQNKISDINRKKKDLIDEIKKLEEIIKNNKNN